MTHGNRDFGSRRSTLTLVLHHLRAQAGEQAGEQGFSVMRSSNTRLLRPREEMIPSGSQKSPTLSPTLLAQF